MSNPHDHLKVLQEIKKDIQGPGMTTEEMLAKVNPSKLEEEPEIATQDLEDEEYDLDKELSDMQLALEQQKAEEVKVESESAEELSLIHI